MSLIDLIADASAREEQRITYWHEVQRQQLAARRAEELKHLETIIGYNFGQTISRDLGLTYTWCEDRAVAVFAHAERTYMLSVSGASWVIGRLDDLEHFGSAGAINNRDIEPENKRQRYDHLLIAIGRAIESVSSNQPAI
jgi:hypothetical protein